MLYSCGFLTRSLGVDRSLFKHLLHSFLIIRQNSISENVHAAVLDVVEDANLSYSLALF